MIGHVKSQQGVARKKLLVLLAVAAIIAVTAVTFLNRPEPAPENQASNPSGYRATADEFMDQLSRGEADKTFNLMTTAGKEDVGGISAWRKKVSSSFSKAKTDPVFVSTHDIQDENGIYANRQPKLVTYSMKLFNADWEVSLTIIKDQKLWRVDRVGTELR
jgi:hypothetical protein